MSNEFNLDAASNKGVTVVRIEEFVPVVTTPTGETIRPGDYFVTSGDGVRKTMQLLIDLRAAVLASPPHEAAWGCDGPPGQSGRTGEASPCHEDPFAELRAAMVGAERLLTYLVRVRGAAVHLESVKENGKIIMCAKNPAKMGRIKRAALRQRFL